MMSFVAKKPPKQAPAVKPASRDDLVRFKTYLSLAMSKTRSQPASKVGRVDPKKKAILNEKITEFVKNLEDFKKTLATNVKTEEKVDTGTAQAWKVLRKSFILFVHSSKKNYLQLIAP